MKLTPSIFTESIASLRWAIVPLVLVAGMAPRAEAALGTVLLSGFEMNSVIQADLAAQGFAGSTIVDPSTFGSVSFDGYSAIWLGWSTNYEGLGARADDLLNFMNRGGCVLIEVPGTNASDLSFVPTYTDSAGNNVNIVDTTTGINAGLTNEGLSNWSSSFHTQFLSGIDGYTGLTDDGTPGNWVSLFQHFGAGGLTLTGQDISFHIQFGAGDIGPFSPKGIFEFNALTCGPAAVVPEPSSLAIVAVAGVGLLGYGRRRRLAMA